VIPIAKPILGEEEKKAVIEVINSGIIAEGPKVKEFEKKFSEYIGVKYAVATSSGTTALHTALLAHEIKPNDEIITTPFTFIATVNSILYCGARPVFADISEEDFNIDPEKIEEKVTKKTKAIIPVHLYGNPCDMDEIMKIATDYNLKVIEDACQAHGASYKGKKVGSFGTGVFSFYPTKNMTTSEGGMITTDNEKIAEKCKLIRSHGSAVRYHHNILGFNYRMTDIEATIGIEQLKKLNSFNKKRIENANYLNKGLSGIKGIISPKIEKNKTHVFHQYTIRVTKDFKITRDELQKKLQEKGVGTAIYYPIPIHLQELYIKLGYKDKLPVSEKISQEVISLPIHPSVTKENLDYIIQTFNNF